MMIIRLGLNLLPRGRRFDSTSPQFSTFLGTFYTAETDEVEDADIELAESSVESGGVEKPA